MIRLILESIFFMLPCYIANSTAVVAKVVPGLKNFDQPIDFGKSWNEKRILGNGKTFRGFIFGTFCAIIVGLAQYLIAKEMNFEKLEVFQEPDVTEVLTLSALLGFGALFGDALKSFVKRRVGIKRGKPWPPFDQLDFIVGALTFSTFVYFPGWKIALLVTVITPLLHLISNIIAYNLKLKDVWW